MRVPKKSIVVLSTNSANVIKITAQCDLDPPQKTDEEKCKLYLTIILKLYIYEIWFSSHIISLGSLLCATLCPLSPTQVYAFIPW